MREPMLGSVPDGAAHLRSMFTTAADQVSEEDYAYTPTPDVRSFGELLAHVAETYMRVREKVPPST